MGVEAQASIMEACSNFFSSILDIDLPNGALEDLSVNED